MVASRSCNVERPVTFLQSHIDITHHFHCKGGEGTLNSKFWLWNRCRTRNLLANIVLRDETLSTPSHFENYPMTISLTLSNYSRFPGSNSLSSTSQLMSYLSKKHVSHDLLVTVYTNVFRLTAQQVFTAGLPGDSNKTHHAGNRRVRPPRLVTQIVFTSIIGPTELHQRGRPSNTYPFCETNQSQCCRWLQPELDAESLV